MFEILKKKALSLGADDFFPSRVKGKRFAVIYQGKIINFGSDIGSTFLEHRDPIKRKNWYARHNKIKNKYGQYVIKLKTSPSYWSAKILW